MPGERFDDSPRSGGNAARDGTTVVRLSGRVQGVGFREHVIMLARRFRVAGTVRNAGHEVEIDVEGEPVEVGRFLHSVEREPPMLARIDAARIERAPPAGHRGFRRAPTTG